MAFSSVWENVFPSNILICIGKYLSIKYYYPKFDFMADVIAML